MALSSFNAFALTRSEMKGIVGGFCAYVGTCYCNDGSGSWTGSWTSTEEFIEMDYYLCGNKGSNCPSVTEDC